MLIRSRRDFLKSSVKSITALSAAGALARFGQINAFASEAPGYQALVCIFLNGGNDTHNVVIPMSTSTQNYGLYEKGRQVLALPQKSLLPIADGKDSYGLNPNMPELQALYNQGKAAIVANLGNLVQPLNRTAFLAGSPSPAALFSHSDQAGQWQTAVPSGIASTGWGGRMTDLLQQHNADALFPPITTTSSCGLFCVGKHTFPATVPSGQVNGYGVGMEGLRAFYRAPDIERAAQELLTFDDGLKLVQAGNSIQARGKSYADTLTSLMAHVKTENQYPEGNALATQLQTVGLNRQIFFCSMGGFDTHQFQTQLHGDLLKQVSQAIGAFYKSTQLLGLENNVTTFTASEFGRTLSPAGDNGSDHAWGSHHFVLGGGVQGGRIYGEFPHLALGGDHDATGRGVLIPGTAITQYGATLAKWFGVDSANLPTVFPTIGNFPKPTLEFLG
jgi:uncharacterized protein (DUF1501 family)